jgi:O-antigen/teichoic acid export membrane protein
MDVDHPEQDQRWDETARNESETERLDRNWNSLLQELRVTQTGAQLVTGFLLTLPFQQRFGLLSENVKHVYLATVVCSIAATLLLVTPVAMHRVLFRQRRLVTLVSVTHRCAITGVVLLGLALVGVAIVVFAAVSGTQVGWIVGACAAVAMCGLWIALPVGLRLNDDGRPGQH